MYIKCLISSLIFIFISTVYSKAEIINVVLHSNTKNDKVVEYVLHVFQKKVESMGWDFSAGDEDSFAPNPDFRIVLGYYGDKDLANRCFQKTNLTGPVGVQSYVLAESNWRDKPVTVALANDATGLLYAVQDYVELLVNVAEIPLSESLPISGSPFIEERALSKFVMNQSEFERYFFEKNYWEEYFDMMVENRYSTFVLIMGYSSAGYFSPPYPFLFDVPGFESVKVQGLSASHQARNKQALATIIDAAKNRGLQLTLGIWTHIYRQEPYPGAPIGITNDNLLAYTSRALPKMLETYPDIDGLQFRVHFESSLPLPQQLEFWDVVNKAIESVRPDIRVDMRAKGFTNDLIEQAINNKLNNRITTKYWGEQMGLPFAPIQLRRPNQFIRRHGYADLLGYPKHLPMHYRLWNLGTTRILNWADPDHGKRFVKNIRELDGDGFEISEPLAFKMGHQTSESYDLIKKQHQYYDWEWQRFWPFFQIFGRAGYNPGLSDEYWSKDFKNHYGDKAGILVMDALHKAGRILPRINAYACFDISADWQWAEKQRNEPLPVYASSYSSDVGQFLSMQEAIRLDLKGIQSPKTHPLETAEWFKKQSDQIYTLIKQANVVAEPKDKKAYAGIIKDLKILAHLAMYHSLRIPAGLNYALYTQTGDPLALKDAISEEKKAIGEWKKIVAITEGYFADNINMGKRDYRMKGNWKDELVKLENELGELSKVTPKFNLESQKVATYDFGWLQSANDDIYIDAPPYDDWWVKVEEKDAGWTNRNLFLPTNDFRWTKKELPAESDRDFLHGSQRTPYATFAVKIPNGTYKIECVMYDSRDEPEDFGSMWITANGREQTAPFEVPAGKRVVKAIESRVTDGNLNLTVSCATNGRWILNSCTVYDVNPKIHHILPQRSGINKPLSINCSVRGVDEIKEVKLIYGNPGLKMATVIMNQTRPGRYYAQIPPITNTGICNYRIEAYDAKGRYVSYPDCNSNKTFGAIAITEDFSAPEIAHKPIKTFSPESSLDIKAKVSDESRISYARVKYRGLNQHQSYNTAILYPTGEGWYETTIPASDLPDRWDLIYYFEICDENGNSDMYPDFELQTPYYIARLMLE